MDKRTDVVATAIAGKMSVFDLETLDLAYSPPFGSANDPINTAGFVASRIARGELVCDPAGGEMLSGSRLRHPDCSGRAGDFAVERLEEIELMALRLAV